MPEEVDTETGVLTKPFDRCWICGKPSKYSEQRVALDPASGRISTWMTYPVTCDLSWVCPRCMGSSGYRMEREIEAGLEGVQALGPDYRMYFVTLTVRHTVDRQLDVMLRVINKALTSMMNSKPVRALVASGLLVGWVAVREITYGDKYGFNPHVHMVVIVRQSEEDQRFALPTDASKQARRDDTTIWGDKTEWRGRRRGLKYRWTRELNAASVALGVYPPLGAHPERQDVRPAQVHDAGRIAGYLTKGGQNWSLAAEMSRTDMKKGRVKNYSIQQLLLSADDGRADHRQRYIEYALATRGLHRMTQSTYAGRPVLEYLREVRDEHAKAEALIARGIGDDPRAVQNREHLQAQAEAFDALPAQVQDEYADRDAAVAESAARRERQWQTIFSWARAEDLSARSGSMPISDYLADPELRAGLETAIRSATSIPEAREAARQFALDHGLPALFRERARLTESDRQARRVRREERAEYAYELDGRREALHERLAERYGAASDELIDEWVEERVYRRLRAYDLEATHRGVSLQRDAQEVAEARERLARDRKANALALVRSPTGEYDYAVVPRSRLRARDLSPAALVDAHRDARLGHVAREHEIGLSIYPDEVRAAVARKERRRRRELRRMSKSEYVDWRDERMQRIMEN